MMAVGDGANDVDMINAAHIGIGIRGADGRHASKNSDISIPEF
jgi:P-type E1-E2 ATPase